MSPAPVMPAPRRGWCPGLARPMPTGDGLLVRLHPVAGRLTAVQARAAARAAREGGNGLLDVTARGNLQIRGVTAQSHARVAAVLAGSGLGDVRHDGGPQRLTLNGPLAGTECRAVVAAVEAIGREVMGLPAKTLVAVEDEAGALGPVEADLWVRITGAFPSPLWAGVRGGGGAGGTAQLDAAPPPPIAPPPCGEGKRAPLDRGPCGAVAVDAAAQDGESALPALQLAVATPDGPLWLAPLPAGATFAILRVLLTRLAISGARRMRALANDQRATLLADLTTGEGPPGSVAVPAGLHGRTLLADFPFGRCDAALLDRLAGWSESHGDGHLGLTPNRGVALVGRDDATAEALRDEAEAAGLIVDPADPRRAVAACPGAPACASGGTPAQADAPRLAAAFAHLARLGATAHVSGCPKGCAHPGPATLTLVGRADGRYGVVPQCHAGTETGLVLTFGAVLERLESTRVPHDVRDAFREPA
ncbi:MULTISPECIES: nitrite reductase [Methylobacterium]|uniref:nitrite reductase n=1 Tax=Methylobacterium TaxID=407 RepID=UPI0013EBDA0A|nr:nitrite reductase [Methylobacterium sp. DB0501]NGM35411.1 nitrite reductase [Methylobacterium sp. DB0501]